ncbi:hypothetical protein, partial [Alloprevotella tannerae]|uniref:hypothetical protein n=1 Tax=Alloprevotella tannerae TaxID=76122 RepID=UPI0036236EBF
SFAGMFCRVVALLQRLPCQKTKPKGLLLRECALPISFELYSDYGCIWGKVSSYLSLPYYRVSSSINNPIGVSLLVG